jgi:Tfp pilus assembly protein PilZ
MTSVTPLPSAPTPFPSKLNRRRYTRVATRQMRSCFLAQGIGPANGWVVDISLGGIFLRTSWPLPVGEQLAIELPRPGVNKPVCVRGRVVSSNPSGTNAQRSGMGVRFDALDPNTAGELRALVSSLAPAGTKLELSPEDNEITAVAPIPAPKVSAPVMKVPTPAPMPKLTAAPMAPIGVAPKPSAPRPLVQHLDDAVELERLKNHTKGLLMQIGDLQLKVASKDKEIAQLREAIVQLQSTNAQLRRFGN